MGRRIPPPSTFISMEMWDERGFYTPCGHDSLAESPVPLAEALEMRYDEPEHELTQPVQVFRRV